MLHLGRDSTNANKALSVVEVQNQVLIITRMKKKHVHGARPERLGYDKTSEMTWYVDKTTIRRQVETT